jgi:hypothetical protein
MVSILCEGLPLGKTAVFPQKTPEYNHLTDTDNTKHSGLTDADNDNKHTLLRDQDG